MEKGTILVGGEPGNDVGPVRFSGLDSMGRPEVEEHFYLNNIFMAAKVEKILADQEMRWDGRLAERDEKGLVQFVRLPFAAPKFASVIKTGGTRVNGLSNCDGCGCNPKGEGYVFASGNGISFCGQCIDLATGEAAGLIARAEGLKGPR